MSAPLKDPLTVNTQDGRCWRLRAWSQDGHGLYALADSTDVVPSLRSIRELAEFGLSSMTDVLPMPVGTAAQSYGPVFPWAALMDNEDLTDFLDELAASAITHASSEVALAEVEKSCATWRLIAEAQHAHNTAPGPDAEADGITRVIVPVQALREPEGEFYGFLHHENRTPHDLPPVRVPGCKCPEPGWGVCEWCSCTHCHEPHVGGV